MAFSAFTSLDDVLRKYQIRHRKQTFVGTGPFPPPSEYYLSEIKFSFDAQAFQRSEAFACEALIYPTLREAWRHYREQLSFFSHETVHADDDLRGELDYMVCRRSPLSPYLPDQPILLVGEAKRDDMQKGWAQALAGMMAARRMAPPPGPVLYGLSTTGVMWSFGKLDGNDFTEDPEGFSVTRPDELFGALHFVFAACRDQLAANPAV